MYDTRKSALFLPPSIFWVRTQMCSQGASRPGTFSARGVFEAMPLTDGVAALSTTTGPQRCGCQSAWPVLRVNAMRTRTLPLDGNTS